MKINFKIIFLFIFLLLILSMISSEDTPTIKVNKYKNLLVFNIQEPFYVDTLVKLNPKIEVVSYTIDNKSIGYINFLGGIGENFLIENNKSYEIISDENLTLVLP